MLVADRCRDLEAALKGVYGVRLVNTITEGKLMLMVRLDSNVYLFCSRSH